jgi:hypothetical protein
LFFFSRCALFCFGFDALLRFDLGALFYLCFCSLLRFGFCALFRFCYRAFFCFCILFFVVTAPACVDLSLSVELGYGLRRAEIEVVIFRCVLRDGLANRCDLSLANCRDLMDEPLCDECFDRFQQVGHSHG